MEKKSVLITLAVACNLLIALIALIHKRPDRFRYERSGVIQAPAEAIFPYLSNLKLGMEWSPYEKKDPNMRRVFSGPAEGVGQIEMLKMAPNQSIQFRLTMNKPVSADNLIEYALTPEGTGTRFSWAMSGHIPFLGKIINLLIDCEKMVTAEFDVGIQNLKGVVEAKTQAS